jgi:YD repeat-containing protein
MDVATVLALGEHAVPAITTDHPFCVKHPDKITGVLSSVQQRPWWRRKEVRNLCCPEHEKEPSMSAPFSRRNLLCGLFASLAGLLHWRWAAPAPASASTSAGHRKDVIRAALLSCRMTTCTYDGYNRLTSVTDGQGTITTVIYHSPRRGPGTTP